MGEYISREAVVLYLKRYSEKEWNPSSLYGMMTSSVLHKAERAMLELPAADVQPVVHAYWIELPKALNPNENPCKCSNCGHVLSFMNYYPKSKYCDDCGARMDGDSDG